MTGAIPAVTVRRAHADELPRLATWNADLIRDERHDSAMSVPELEARLRGWLTEGYAAYVFEAGGEAFGYALFRELDDCMHLRHFFVVPHHRRRGLGRRALERLREEVFVPDKRILVEVLVWNAEGAAFWKSVGFAERYLGLQMPGWTPSSSPKEN